MSLGWSHKRRQKGIYYDGHERPDVREARKVFLDAMQEFEKLMCKYSGDDCEIVTPPNLPAGQQELVLVVHDESTVYAYEAKMSRVGGLRRVKALNYREKRERADYKHVNVFG